tara:strand:- start:268 stop:429 length:162 start_codon:yes stop_codon:yes gene_type:complete
MKTYYIGILMDYGLPNPTEVYDDPDECEDACLSITDDYVVVSFQVDEIDYKLH